MLRIFFLKPWERARVAELVDALDLGSSPGNRVGVQIPPLAPTNKLVRNK